MRDHFDQVLLLKAANRGLTVLQIRQADPQDQVLVVHADICRHLFFQLRVHYA